MESAPTQEGPMNDTLAKCLKSSLRGGKGVLLCVIRGVKGG